MKTMLRLTSLALLLAACGPNDLQSKIVDDSPEALADVLPPDLFGKSGGSESLLPSSMTEGEVATQIKADGWDPRDDHPYFKFTTAPGDVGRMPGEFEPAKALLVGWPGGASSLTSFFAEMIAAAAPEVESTVVYVNSSSLASQLLSALQSIGADTDTISFIKMPLDTIWMRDYGPEVVETADGGSRIIDTRYYYGRWQDDVAPTRLASAWGIPVSRPPLESEGGNFQSDGAGRCITTQWMVTQNKSRNYTEKKVKDILRDYFGCQTSVILPTMDGEGTGHVDMYVTITGPGEAIVGKYDTADDWTNAKIVDQGAKMLEDAGFKVRRVPMPGNWDGVFRSYTNSLAIGKRVLVPVYSDDKRYEKDALEVFKKAYPGFTIIPIDSTKIIRWAGAVHCVTMTL